MTKGDIVRFKANGYDGGRGRAVKVLAVYNENTPPACRLDIGEGGMVVRQSECEPEADYQARMQDAQLAKDRETYKDVINAWENGHRTNKAIAEFLHVPTASIPNRVKAAQRRGFISSD